VGAIATRRRRRLEHKEELRNRGIQPARIHRVMGVRITAILMPDWARARSIEGLSVSDSFGWFRPSDARFLMRLDREAGGEPRSAEAEYRRCEVCGRPLIGEAARMRRELDESCRTGRQLPCGQECLDAARDGRWRAPDAQRRRGRTGI